MALRLGAPSLLRDFLPGSGTSPADLLASLSSRYPNPTNAVALAALDMFIDTDIAAVERQAESSGVSPPDELRRFLLPDGVFPRMRLLAWGWEKPGDRFRSPTDGAWWKARYQYPLWSVLDTYLLFAPPWLLSPENAGGELAWDAELAAGDAGELSRNLAAVVERDLPPVTEAPCPRYLIPPGRRQLPIPNPACVKPPGMPPTVPSPSPSPRSPSGIDSLWWVILLLLLAED